MKQETCQRKLARDGAAQKALQVRAQIHGPKCAWAKPEQADCRLCPLCGSFKESPDDKEKPDMFILEPQQEKSWSFNVSATHPWNRTPRQRNQGNQRAITPRIAMLFIKKDSIL